MNENKKNILQEQVTKLDEVLQTLEKNFNLEEELMDEYSFLSIVKENFDGLFGQYGIMHNSKILEFKVLFLTTIAQDI